MDLFFWQNLRLRVDLTILYFCMFRNIVIIIGLPQASKCGAQRVALYHQFSETNCYNSSFLKQSKDMADWDHIGKGDIYDKNCCFIRLICFWRHYAKILFSMLPGSIWMTRGRVNVSDQMISRGVVRTCVATRGHLTSEVTSWLFTSWPGDTLIVVHLVHTQATASWTVASWNILEIVQLLCWHYI